MRLQPQQQQQQQQEGEEGKQDWDGVAAPPVGSRLDCLDVFRNLQTAQAGSAWRPAVVVGVRDKDDGERDIKVHFEEFSSGYDKWISWPRERNRFASLGRGGSLGTPPGLADRPGGGRPAARSGHTDRDADADAGSGVSESRSNSSFWEADGRSSSVASTGATRMKPALRKKGFSRLKVFSAVKSILRAQVDVYGVYDTTNVGHSSCSERATPTPPFTVSPGTSMSPGSPIPSGTAGRRDEGVGGRKTRDESAAPPFEKIPLEGEEEVKREEAEMEEEEEEKEGGFEQEEKFEAETKDEEREAGGMGEAEEGEEKRERAEERKSGPGVGAGEPSPTFCFSSLVPPPPCAAEGDRHSHPAAPVAAAGANEGEGGIALPPRPRADGSTGVDPCATSGAAAAGAAAAAPVGAAAAASAGGKAPAKQRMGGWRTKIKSRNRNRPRPRAPLRDADEAEARATVKGGADSNHVVESERGAREEDGRAAAAAAKEVGGGGGKSPTGGGGQEAVAVSRRPALEQPIRELTPHLVEEEGGFFTLTVFRNNKQDQVPVPVVCGRYVSAYEAERAAEAFSSPVWHEPSPDSRCSECNSNFRAVLARRRHHCRNCGRLVCSSCAMRFWPKSMLPYSYRTDSTEIRVRVCRTCYSSGNDFRRALLLGSFPDAMEAYNRGCVNLRAPCSQSDMELPVHCAAAGGNVSLLAWLVEDRCCPIFRNQDKTYPLLDAKGRSVMAAAAHSGQVKIMRYLTFTQPSTVMDVGWVALWRGLHLCLSQGEAGGKGGSSGGGSSGRNSGSGANNISDVCGWAPYSQQQQQQGVSAAKSSCGGGVQRSCYPLGGGIEGAAWRNDGRGGGGGYHDDEWAISAGAGGDEGNPLAQAVLGGADDGGYAVYDMPGTRSQNDDIGRGGGGGKGKNVCIVCFARKVNCTFVPCGHHCCCMPCTAKFELCPVCNVRITQKVKAIDA